MEEQNKILENLQFLSDSGWTVMVGGSTMTHLTAQYNRKYGITEVLPSFNGDRYDIGLDHFWENRHKTKFPSNGLMRRLRSSTDIVLLWIECEKADNARDKDEKYRRDYHFIKKDELYGISSERIQKNGFKFKYDFMARIFLPEK